MKLGIDAVAYVNTATMPTGWTTPTWAAMDWISDLATKEDWDHAEVIIRRSWIKQGAKTVIDIGVTCKMLREPQSNAAYVKVINALHSRNTLDLMILDAAQTVDGASGVRFIGQVIKGGGSQNPTEALFRDIEFLPFPDPDPTHIPAWVLCTGGTAAFTPINAAGTATLTGAMGADVLAGEFEVGGQAAPPAKGPRAEAWRDHVGAGLAEPVAAGAA